MAYYDDAIDAVAGQYKGAAEAVTSDGTPDDALRAFQISQATGLPAETVAANPDEIEKANKQHLAQQILNQNSALTSFVQAHPLHGQLVSDDLGNLHNFNQAYERLASIDSFRAGARGFAAGWGSERLGSYYADKIGPNTIANHPLLASLGAVIGVPFEAFARTFSGGLGFFNEFTTNYLKENGFSDTAARKFTNDVTGMLEYELMKPSVRLEPGRPVPSESPAPPSEGAGAGGGVATSARQFADRIGPYLEAGEKPPPGLSPITDKLHEFQTETNAEKLQEAFDTADKTLLKERSPEKFRELMDHGPQQTVRIPTEALQDPKVAEALGVPPERLQVPGSVTVQAKDLLSLEKDQFKAIADDVAVGDGLSKNEVKELEPPRPTARPVDPVLDTIRETSGLEPKPLPTLKPSDVEGVQIPSDAFNVGATAWEVPIKGEEGKSVGKLRFEIQSPPGQKTAIQVRGAAIQPRYRGQGFGIKAYQQLADYALDTGQELWSDSHVEPEAVRIYEALKRRGYTVEEGERPRFKVTAGPAREPTEAGAGVPLSRQAIGRTGRELTRYEQLIAQRDAEDVEWRLKRAEAQATRENSADWKAEADSIRSEVEAEVRARPEIAAYRFFDDGQYVGQKLQRRPKLARDRLTDEQIDQLPDRFVSDRGLDPDDAANLFGYQTGAELIRAIASTEREASGFRGDIVDRLTSAEVQRRVNEKLGETAAERLEEAKDHALSTTQMEMLHEQMMALGTRIGRLPDSAFATEFGALRLLDEEVFGAMKSDRYLREAGKASRRLEKALLADDPLTAFQNAQAQYISAQMAKGARKVEKLAKVFDRQAKRFRDREPANFEAEYTNWIHDILMRLDRPVDRTFADLQTEIAAQSDTSLTAFLDSKRAAGREIFVPDWLVDPSFSKPIEELPVAQAREAMRAVNSLIKNGREENQIIVAGEKMDRKEFMDKAVEQLSALGPATDLSYSSGPWAAVRKVGRSYLAMTLQVESILNRWDKGNAFGLFNKWVGRPLFEAASYEAKLDKEIGGAYGRLPGQLDKTDLNAAVPNTLFKRPMFNADGTFDFDSQPPVPMTKRNLRAVLLNAGNPSNLKKLADGYQVQPAQIMQWLFDNTTKADWDWAQAHGDLFKRLKSESDNMYRRMSGMAPEAVEVQPIQTPFGTYQGWYHPLIYDDHYVMSKRKAKGEDLFSNGYVRASTPAGYTLERTGYSAPLSLDLDAVPGRFYQEIHDIAFREAVVNASKVFYEPRFRNAVRTYYGREFEDLFIPYLQDVANSSVVQSGNQAAWARWSEYARQNIIGVMVGLNPRTVQKHTLTAAMNSITEVGASNFLSAFRSLWDTDPARGQKNWDWAMEKFEELGRRHQNYMESVRGAQQSALEGPSLRKTMLQLGTTPVAYLDLLTAVPTAIAEYGKAIEAGASEADAVYAANRAVRRAHGSTAITNRPEIMRRGIAGLGSGWITSLYSFMNHIANRQYELAWKAKETAELAKAGEVDAAMEHVPHLALGLFSYVLFVAIVDELVTPSGGGKDTFEEQVKKGGLKMAAAPWPIVRDAATAIVEHKDPTLGLGNTEAKAFTDLTRDIWKGDYGLNKQHAGKTIKHAITAFGAATGLTNGEMGNLAEYLYDLHTGKARPKDMKDWWRGLTKGETRPRENRPDLVERGLRVIEGGR